MSNSSLPPSNPQQVVESKPQAASHMFWFFILPCVGFLIWASIRLTSQFVEKKEKTDLLTKVSAISLAKNSGDRWQAAYALAEDLQKMSRDGSFAKLDAAKKHELHVELNSILDQNTTDVRLKRYLFLTLGQMGEVESLPVIEKSFRDADSELRFFAVWSYIQILEKNPAHRSSKELLALEPLFNDQDSSVRKIVGAFLGQIQGDRYLVALEKQLGDADKEVRLNAAVVLTSMGKQSGVPTLKELFDLKTLRSFDFRSVEDMKKLLHTAYGAAKKSGNQELLKAAGELKKNVNPATPEGQAIHSVL